MDSGINSNVCHSSSLSSSSSSLSSSPVSIQPAGNLTSPGGTSITSSHKGQQGSRQEPQSHVDFPRSQFCRNSSPKKPSDNLQASADISLINIQAGRPNRLFIEADRNNKANILQAATAAFMIQSQTCSLLPPDQAFRLLSAARSHFAAGGGYGPVYGPQSDHSPYQALLYPPPQAPPPGSAAERAFSFIHRGGPPPPPPPPPPGAAASQHPGGVYQHHPHGGGTGGSAGAAAAVAAAAFGGPAGSPSTFHRPCLPSQQLLESYSQTLINLSQQTHRLQTQQQFHQHQQHQNALQAAAVAAAAAGGLFGPRGANLNAHQQRHPLAGQRLAVNSAGGSEESDRSEAFQLPLTASPRFFSPLDAMASMHSPRQEKFPPQLKSPTKKSASSEGGVGSKEKLLITGGPDGKSSPSSPTHGEHLSQYGYNHHYRHPFRRQMSAKDSKAEVRGIDENSNSRDGGEGEGEEGTGGEGGRAEGEEKGLPRHQSGSPRSDDNDNVWHHHPHQLQLPVKHAFKNPNFSLFSGYALNNNNNNTNKTNNKNNNNPVVFNSAAGVSSLSSSEGGVSRCSADNHKRAAQSTQPHHAFPLQPFLNPYPPVPFGNHSTIHSSPFNLHASPCKPYHLVTPPTRGHDRSPPLSSSSSSSSSYSARFLKGSLIQLAGGQLKPVEELRTDDFIRSADICCSPRLSIGSSRVVHMSQNHENGTAVLAFAVGKEQLQVTVEASLEHPFFVFGRGWSSGHPMKTFQRYGLECHPLTVGDVCISLVQRDLPPTSSPGREGTGHGSGVGNYPGVTNFLGPHIAADSSSTAGGLPKRRAFRNTSADVKLSSREETTRSPTPGSETAAANFTTSVSATAAAAAASDNDDEDDDDKVNVDNVYKFSSDSPPSSSSSVSELHKLNRLVAVNNKNTAVISYKQSQAVYQPKSEPKSSSRCSPSSRNVGRNHGVLGRHPVGFPLPLPAAARGAASSTVASATTKTHRPNGEDNFTGGKIRSKGSPVEVRQAGCLQRAGQNGCVDRREGGRVKDWTGIGCDVIGCVGASAAPAGVAAVTTGRKRRWSEPSATEKCSE